MRLVFKFFFPLLFLLLFVPKVFAADNSFVTIVNPVRISTYNTAYLASLQQEYSQVKGRDFPATWLMTYDVLQRPEMVHEFKQMNDKQELGLFLEIRPKLAHDSNVTYHVTGQWYRATSLFLSGYTQDERKKLIDTLFAKFKSEFGYYPKSVGAWWVDSYSLEYMKEKFGITGVLGVSDQYDLDGYQVWGTPWSIPYYPSKINAAVPASDISNTLSIVTFRWASRDPLNGYKSPSKEQASIYSTQDYERLGLDSTYFENLVKIFAIKNDQNKFGQITIGLEADYTADTYGGEFSRWMNTIKDLQDNQDVKVTNMKEFSKWYISSFPNLSPSSFIYSDDLLGTQKQAFWFQSPRYRVGLVYDKNSKTLKVKDLRIYNQNLVEPFYTAPNGQYFLSINLPYLIDTIIEKNSGQTINSGELISIDKKTNGTSLKFKSGEIVFGNDSMYFKSFKIPKKILDSRQINTSQKNGFSVLTFKTNYPIGQNGIVFANFSPHIPFAIKHRVERFKVIAYFLAVVVFFILIFLAIKKRKLFFSILTISLLLLAGYFVFQYSNKYYISQTEYDALQVLSHMSPGTVLVYDKDCLRCSFQSTYKPAATAGIKNYVSKYSNKKILLDFDFQTAASSKTARQVLINEKVKYIYLTKYESFIEQLPYIPQDLGIVRLYENANAEIWEVK